MKGILITGGEKPEAHFLKGLMEETDLLIAADSGIEWALDHGFRPDFFTGDMDSMRTPGVLRGVPDEKIIQFSTEKDETDTEIGLRLLKEQGCTHRTIWGGGGGRMDHFLAIAVLFDREDPPDEWYTAKEHFRMFDESIELSGMKGKRISLFPLGRETCRMSSLGLKWPLDDLIWEKGDFGLSNIIDENKMIITVKQGKLLLVSDLGEADRP